MSTRRPRPHHLPPYFLLCALLTLNAYAQHADDTTDGAVDYSVGILRVQFVSSDVQPDLDPLRILKAEGIKTDPVANYSEQANLDGVVEYPVLLAQSSPQAIGRWCDVVVPFSTEKFWIQLLSAREGVTSVRRKSFDGVRSSDPLAPALSISQDQINKLEAPTLQFVLSGETKTALDAVLAFCRNSYGTDHASEGQSVDPNSTSSARFFDIKNLWQKLFNSPPWQQIHITAVLTPGEAGHTMLRLVFTGDGAFGMAPPPRKKFKSFLLDGIEAANFRDYISHLGTDLRASLVHAGFTVE